MPQLSINQLSELTGKDRRTITQRLADLHHIDGEKGAYLYHSDEALELIYGGSGRGKTLEAAKTEQAIEQAKNYRLKNEELQRERIPHAVIDEVEQETFTSIAATLKAAKGKTLTAERINDLLGKLRAMPAQRDARHG